MTDQTLLSVNGLAAYYGRSQALFDISLNVREGEVVALLGRNGMGKTTTIRSIMGLIGNKSGEIRFDGGDISALRPYLISRRGIGLVPEGRQIFPTLTVKENLLALSRGDGSRPYSTLKDIYTLFPRMQERERSLGRQLSGGEQQMLAVSRALMTSPKLLVLDEATEGLAPLIRLEIWNCIRHLKEAGISIMVVDKNLAEMKGIVDRCYVIEKGNVAWNGDFSTLIADSSITERYLGV